MLTPGVAPVTGVKFSPPFTANVLPNLRVTAVPVSALKVKELPFNVLIRVSNLETASPTLVTESFSLLVSFVILYVGAFKVPSLLTVESPPSAVANSDLAVCN